MRMSYKKGKEVKKKSNFGMLSVKAGIDKNPNPTQADRIAGAKMGDLKKAIQKTKGSKAKLSQTIFELKNKMPLTFKKTKKKTMKETEKKKKIMKDNNKVIGRMFKKALEKK